MKTRRVKTYSAALSHSIYSLVLSNVNGSSTVVRVPLAPSELSISSYPSSTTSSLLDRVDVSFIVLLSIIEVEVEFQGVLSLVKGAPSYIVAADSSANLFPAAI